MTSINTEDERALLTIPIAAAWILLEIADLRRVPRPVGSAVVERSGA